MNRQTTPNMIDVPEAQRLVLQAVRPGPVVEVPLGEALFRTLAEPVTSDLDQPPFDRSLMDGYAVRAADVAHPPVTLRLVGQIAAGSMADRAVGSGEAMQINTGAPIPQGADAVVRVEETELRDDGRAVLIRAKVEVGTFITRRGSYALSGQVVLERGMRLTPLEVAAAASAGAARLRVYRQPTVSTLVTGDELVDASEKPEGGQIRNSNGYLLESLVRAHHASPVSLGVVRDDRESIESMIQDGSRADFLCITGGVSMGAFDFVPEVLAGLGATVHFQKMVIKPGRPILFATLPSGCHVFALPGNPISAFVGFHLLVRWALKAFEGRNVEPTAMLRAALVGSMKANEKRRSYWPGHARVTSNGTIEVTPLAWQGSGDPFGMASANVLIMRPPMASEATSGDAVQVLPLDSGVAG